MTDARPPRRPPYGPISTLLLGLVLCAVMVLAQGIVMVSFAVMHKGPRLGSSELSKLAMRGDVLSIATCSSVLAVGGSIVVLVLLRRGPSLVDYLGLRAVSGRTLALAALLAVGLALFSDAFLLLLGRPVVHPSMRHAFQTAGNQLPLLCVAVVVAAPICEELIFRGFLHRGWADRMPPWLLAVLTALPWAALHTQYGPSELFTIFVGGLALSELRRRTGSLWPPLLCHAMLNVGASIETLLL
jgi:uncharacterized protein